MASRTFLLAVALTVSSSALDAQTCIVGGSCSQTAAYTTGICGLADMSCVSGGPNPPQCSVPNSSCGGVASCREPIAFPVIDVIPDGLTGNFQARLAIDARVGWIASDHAGNPNIQAKTQWFDLPATPLFCGSPGNTEWCTYFNSDHFLSYVLQTGLTCTGAPYDFGIFSARVSTCEQPCPCPPFATEACICSPPGAAETWVEFDGLPFVVTAKALGCEEPKKHSCNGDKECHACVGGSPRGAPGPEGPSGGGKGPGVGIGGDGPGISPEDSGPGTWLRYQAGGVGNPGSPGWTTWNASMGRFWSHDFAERIVPDPDESHVWLITRFATFREFSNLLPSGLYGDVSPSDEYRQLYRTIDGWELHFLDGTVQYFDNSGRWDRTEDKNQNLWEAFSYSGNSITEVRLPDNRRELFSYSPTGRLASIQVVGTDNSSTLTWGYDWVGPDLYQIRRPDGTQWRFTYGRLDLPGYVTLMELVGTGSSQPRLIEGRWEYDSYGNVVRYWRGAALFTDPAAVDRWELSYDDPSSPTETTVTDPLGGQSVYTFDRDTVSDKERVTAIQGSCPVCGGPPSSSFTYDPAHPLRVATATDPEGTRTDFTYDSHGQIQSKTEGANVSGHPHLPRITEWEHDPDYPAFVTRIEGPTRVPDVATRVATMDYDSSGNLIQRAHYGNEATYPGASFALVTSYPNYTSAGRVETIDPPGYGTSDQTLYDYSLGNHNGMLVDRRTDPLVGMTQFTYDVFNRPSTVTDPNLVVTETLYDSLNRRTSTTNFGASGTTDDRTTTYLYNAFGDLSCIKYPAGGAVQYIYDQDVTDDVPNTAARRVVQERRGSAHSTATTCLLIDSSNPAERRFFTLDAAGHQTNERLDRGTSASAWTAHSETSYLYSSMCHLDKTIQAPGKPEEAVTEYGYDCAGNVESVWDPMHPRASFPSQPSSVYAHDAVHRLTDVTQPWGGSGGGTTVTSYSYDVQDHLVEVIDGNGTVTSYEYSDRDLMTEQTSEVAGVASYSYNEHGEKVTHTDGRGIITSFTVDAADRTGFADYPGTALDTTYTYGSTPALFDVGRLTSIARPGSTISYGYNPFGDLLTDGVLTYTRDKHGSPLTINYPGSLQAIYVYDKMDRPIRLQSKEGAAAAVDVVMTSPVPTYKAYGPLATYRLNLTTDRDVTRSYDFRYQPVGITVAGSLLSMSYITDKVGNVTQQQRTLPGPTDTRVYTYQDWQYSLASATGPWTFTSWTYDRGGNRKNENLGGDYYYQSNAAMTGLTSELTAVTPGILETSNYTFDSGGYLDLFHHYAGGPLLERQIDLTNDAAGQLSGLAATAGSMKDRTTSMTYDGRNFLKELLEVQTGGYVRPTYSSAGALHSLERLPATGGTTERINVLYFAGSPIALWKKVGTAAATTTRLITDHLGTPYASIQESGTALDWYGGFKPFGEDWQAGTAQDSLAKGIFLRMPGQWKDPLWGVATYRMELFYNLYRWYEPQTGRYLETDPNGLDALRRAELFILPPAPLHSYVDGNPVSRMDPLGNDWAEWWIVPNFIKCRVWDRRCSNESQCCFVGGGYRDMYGHADEEEMLELFTEGHLLPQFSKCFLEQPSCQKMASYCPSMIPDYINWPGRVLKGKARRWLLSN